MPKYLNKNYKVIAYDHIGSGYSSRPECFKYRLQDHIDILNEFVEAKKLKKLAKDDERGSGNILRINYDGQFKLTEAAIDDLRKIVKTKSMGKVSGTKVDLFSASAMVQVYDALNDKNRAKSPFRP